MGPRSTGVKGDGGGTIQRQLLRRDSRSRANRSNSSVLQESSGGTQPVEAWAEKEGENAASPLSAASHATYGPTEKRMRVITGTLMAAILAALPQAAHAGGSIALEVSTGPRPTDAAELLRPAYDELARHGFTVGPALVRDVERSISRGAGQLTASQTLEAQRWVGKAYEALAEGRYETAASTALRALALYDSAPGQLAREPALRDQQYKALIIASRSYEVLGRSEDSFRYMSMAVRSFPDRHVSAAEFDPRVNALFRRVKAELEKQGTGSLEIEVDDPAAVIFLAGRFVGTGTAKVSPLFPGDFEVFVAKATSSGRVHTVRVNPGETARLSVSWALDSALRSGSDDLFVELPAGATSKQELATAVKLARDLGAKSVVVLGIRQLDDRRAVVGYSIETGSLTKTFAAVQIEPVEPPPEVLGQLGALLAGQKDVDTRGIVTSEAALRAAMLGQQHDGPWYTDRWGLGLGGAGIVLTGVAVGLLWSADGLRDDANVSADEATRDRLRDRAGTRSFTGSLVGAAGAGLLVAGAVKLFWPSHSRNEDAGLQAAATVTFGAGWVSVGGRF